MSPDRRSDKTPSYPREPTSVSPLSFGVSGEILNNSFPSVTSSVPFPSAAPYLDPRFPRPAINSSLVPQHRSALLLGTISRVLGFGYPPMTADVANRDPHSQPAHVVIVLYSAPRTQYY